MVELGHGIAGQFTVGRPLRCDDDSAIAQFWRLRKFTAISQTNVSIVGCEAAAEAPCNFGPLRVNGRVRDVCQGPFTGDMSKPGYLILRKLAETMNAPVKGSTWRLAIKDGWSTGAAYLVVAPDGHWTYTTNNGLSLRTGGP